MNEKQETMLAVSGMTCASCVRHVDHALREVDGVEDVEVRLSSGRVRVVHGADSSLEELVEALREAGYDAVRSLDDADCVAWSGCVARP